ncbi:MAG TPA: DUF2167 domain-containing protein [Methylomirabilota bacterium]
MATITRLLLSACIMTAFASVAAADGELPAGWMAGPTMGQLGQYATVSLPEGYVFLDAPATARFLEENQNIPDGDELGTILRMRDDQYWFAVFSYADSGHITDDDRDEIDAAALMESMQEGSEAANEERRKRGWDPLILEGWHREPFYDLGTQNLTWATRLSSSGHPVINHSVRLLGRTGFMSVQLVADQQDLDWATAEFNSVVDQFSFVSGQRYAEFRAGDKLAGYGLAALIAGGAGAAAVKTGFFKKFFKLIILGFVGLLAALKKFFGRLFGGEAENAGPATAGGTR